MIKLVQEKRPERIWVGDMKDGDIGVIVNWPVGLYGIYLDSIVQRYHDNLIVVGKKTGCGWSGIFTNNNLSTNCCVRLLKKDEILIVV